VVYVVKLKLKLYTSIRCHFPCSS